MWVGRATWTKILLLRLNNKGTTEGRKTRLANSACVNRRRLVEGAQQSERETRESSRLPAIPFVTKGVTLLRCPTLTRTIHSRETFGRTGPFVTQRYPTPFKRILVREIK